MRDEELRLEKLQLNEKIADEDIKVNRNRSDTNLKHRKITSSNKSNINNSNIQIVQPMQMGSTNTTNSGNLSTLKPVSPLWRTNNTTKLRSIAASNQRSNTKPATSTTLTSNNNPTGKLVGSS